MKRMTLLILLICTTVLAACGNSSPQGDQMLSYRDQEGRVIELPRHITRISGDGVIIYALRQQDKLVDRGMYYGIDAEVMARVDPQFEARPNILDGNKTNCEALAALQPQVVFANAAFHREDKKQMETAGLKVFSIKGETIGESFEAVRLMGQVLGCDDNVREYLTDCNRLLKMVEDRTRDIPKSKRLRVLFAGPKSVYTVATGEMLQSEILSRAGAENVASSLKGFWCDVSPEQVALWNPDVIFLGSSKGVYGVEQVYLNSQFKTIKAVKEHRVYAFPSNIGWWDFPAPHCVLGVVWSARTLYPERFADVDMQKIADEFYARYRGGHTFTELGGKL